MEKRRIKKCPILLMVIVILSGGWCLGEESGKRIKISEDIFLEQLSENVFLHETFKYYKKMGRIGANGLVVVSGKEALLIDTPWNNRLTAVLCDWFLKEKGITINQVVGGHSHIDCLGGLGEMHRRGARSYGYSLTAAFAREKDNPVPKHVFDDSMTLTLGTKKIVMQFCGAGHTRDNIVVWLPEEKILFGGCLVKALNWKGLGYMKEGDLASYPGTIDRVMKQFPDARMVVPGHGQRGTRMLLTHTRQLAAGMLKNKKK